LSAAASRPLRRVGVVAKRGSREAERTAGELIEWLRGRGLDVFIDPATLAALGRGGSEFSPAADYDLVVVLGGDGTLLAAARTLGPGVPILGVNLGNLGFLTEIGRAALYPALLEVLAGRFHVEARSLFDVERRDAAPAASAGAAASPTGPAAGPGAAPSLVPAPGAVPAAGLDAATAAAAFPAAARAAERFLVLNDAVITKSALSRIIDLTIEVDGHLIVRYRSDGLIISTPTGSTAYNLSAGGPIVYPLLPVAVITPICPHALSLRPIVVPGASRIEVTLETQREEVYLTLDGQEGTRLGYRDVVAVTQSAAQVHLVKVRDRSFYSNLREKLRWGGLDRPDDPAGAL
jgi:NAD+ kinase